MMRLSGRRLMAILLAAFAAASLGAAAPAQGADLARLRGGMDAAQAAESVDLRIGGLRADLRGAEIEAEIRGHPAGDVLARLKLATQFAGIDLSAEHDRFLGDLIDAGADEPAGHTRLQAEGRLSLGALAGLNAPGLNVHAALDLEEHDRGRLDAHATLRASATIRELAFSGGLRLREWELSALSAATVAADLSVGACLDRLSLKLAAARSIGPDHADGSVALSGAYAAHERLTLRGRVERSLSDETMRVSLRLANRGPGGALRAHVAYDMATEEFTAGVRLALAVF